MHPPCHAQRRWGWVSFNFWKGGGGMEIREHIPWTYDGRQRSTDVGGELKSGNAVDRKPINHPKNHVLDLDLLLSSSKPTQICGFEPGVKNNSEIAGGSRGRKWLARLMGLIHGNFCFLWLIFWCGHKFCFKIRSQVRKYFSWNFK